MNNLDNEKIIRMGKDEKIVGGHHAQAEKFRAFWNWLLQGGAKVFFLFVYLIAFYVILLFCVQGYNESL